MAKNVFKPTEIVNLTKQVKLESPFSKVEEMQDLSPVEEYLGPTADDLRREAESFKKSWEKEKEEMIKRAQSKAESIVSQAEQVAQKKLDFAEESVKNIKEASEKEAELITEGAKQQAERIIEEAEKQVEQVHNNAKTEGFQKGKEEGYNEGRAEVDRLIEHLRTIIAKTIEKRTDIINESEKQIVELILLICQKVVKVISENQKNVVINNVAEALKRLKNKGEIVVRVNIDDASFTNEHVQDFLSRFENVKSMTVLEDSSIDKGGCIVETDFGLIDARISSQLKEIEEKIIEASPILTDGAI